MHLSELAPDIYEGKTAPRRIAPGNKSAIDPAPPVQLVVADPAIGHEVLVPPRTAQVVIVYHSNTAYSGQQVHAGFQLRDLVEVDHVRRDPAQDAFKGVNSPVSNI